MWFFDSRIFKHYLVYSGSCDLFPLSLKSTAVTPEFKKNVRKYFPRRKQAFSPNSLPYS